jgi:cell division protein FtsN
MSDLFKVELSRGRAIAICVCAAGACVLLFVAGTATGLLLASGAVGPQIAQAVPAETKRESIPAEGKTGAASNAEANSSGTTDGSAGQSSNPPSLAVLSNPPRPSTTQSAPEDGPAAAPQTAPAPTPVPPPAAPANPARPPAATSVLTASSDLVALPSESSATDGLPLAVKVCSFSGKIGADNLASLLDSKGYRASVIRSIGAQGRVWYVVTVGPYSQWNAAASAAAQMATLANVQPVVGELR